MVIEKLLLMIQSAIFAMLDFLNLPVLPDDFVNLIYDFFDLLDHAKQFILFFIPPGVFNLVCPVFLVLFAFEHTYSIVMWVIRKIPVSID